MKRVSLIFLSLFINSVLCSQQEEKDSLLQIISKNLNDSDEVNALILLGYKANSPDSAFNYLKQGLSIAEKLNYKKGMADCNLMLGGIVGSTTNFGQSLQY